MNEPLIYGDELFGAENVLNAKISSLKNEVENLMSSQIASTTAALNIKMLDYKSYVADLIQCNKDLVANYPQRSEIMTKEAALKSKRKFLQDRLAAINAAFLEEKKIDREIFTEKNEKFFLENSKKNLEKKIENLEKISGISIKISENFIFVSTNLILNKNFVAKFDFSGELVEVSPMINSFKFEEAKNRATVIGMHNTMAYLMKIQSKYL